MAYTADTIARGLIKQIIANTAILKVGNNIMNGNVSLKQGDNISINYNTTDNSVTISASGEMDWIDF